MGQTLQLVRQKCMAKGCLNVLKKRFRGEIIAFFATVLVEMDSGNVDTRKA